MDSTTSFKTGDAVLTKYGVGVISGQSENGFFSVRLWRTPGKSIATSCTAKLGSLSIIGRLPAAPGMLTLLRDRMDSSENNSRVLVMAYNVSRNAYLVGKLKETGVPTTENGLKGIGSSIRRSSPSIILADQDYVEVSPEQLLPSAPSAKFYPLLESLMLRAEQTAATTSQLLRSERTKKIVDSTGKAIKEQVAQLGSTPQASGTAEKLEDLATSVQKAAPGIEENVKQVMTMVKDEEITVLFEKCKARLEQLRETNISDATEKALEKTGIRIQLDDSSSFSASMAASRKAALASLEQFLKQAELDDLDLRKVRGDLTKNFTSAFDSLSQAAKSDRSLNELFENLRERTTKWQEVSGRVMTTRSASLFLEGASRIQARAATIFGQGQFATIGDIGSKLTKSVTEGDAALARLKSIELGEAVKSRLVEAIEVRSESMGGLDGIIVGALTTADGSGNRIQKLLQTLQNTSSSATVNAHETLISILSSRSTYRDQALLSIEQALCGLGDQIGDDLSPDEIAAMVRGEGGSAKLFQPIAQRAMEQIEKQLDSAESQIQDTTILGVLKRVRKIMSGELTLNAVMDDIVNVLNDDKIVAAGEGIVQQSEQVLDVLEGVSANKAMSGAMQLVERAGITKESVMREFEKLNVDEILDKAGEAVTDERARRRLLSSATDAALDFILRILPSMPVPPFEGVKDGLVYHISNLSMEGFRVDKKNIAIELAGMRATKRVRRSRHRNVPTYDNSVSSNGMGEIKRSISTDSSVSSMSSGGSSFSDFDVQDLNKTVSAKELLIIDVKGISAVLDNAHWSFEQTYLPYLKGSGDANIKMTGGSIRLQFELRKRLKEKHEGAENKIDDWEPVLCLHDRTCSIAEVELSIEGEGRLTWIVNKIASVFKGPLRDYVVSVIVKVLSKRSGWILERLNKILSPYWDLILRTARLNLPDLVEADEDVIVTEPVAVNASLVELVWRERLPLGMNLLLNDESGALKVVDFPRGSQARTVCEKRGFDPDAFEGASVVAVNGSEYYDQEELFDALKDPGRPKTVGFELAESAEAERLQRFINGGALENKKDDKPREFTFHKVEFDEAGELGIEFGGTLDSSGLCVAGFVEGNGGLVLAAERSGRVKFGDILTHINEEPVIGLDDGQARAVSLLESVADCRPLTLTFTRPYLFKVVVTKPEKQPGVDSNGGPEELVFGEIKESDKRRVVVKDFKDVSGMAEASGILIGDHLVFINGAPVGIGCRWLDTEVTPSTEEVYAMLEDESQYPIGLTFARPLPHTGSRWTVSKALLKDSDAETICVTANNRDRVGCIYGEEDTSDIVVTDFAAVPGIFQQAMSHCKDEHGQIRVSIESINGQFVPSYATADMVRNALKRSWKATETAEMLVCDFEQKTWLFSNLNE